MNTFERAVGGMADIPQWFVWRLEWNATEGKYNKVPWVRGVGAVEAGKPENWLDYDNAIAALQQMNQGTNGLLRYALGFWLTAEVPYWFLDIDMRKCNLAPYKATDFATQLVQNYPGAFVEWSSGLKGLHVIGSGDVVEHRSKPPKEISRQLAPLELEFYSQDRGIAFGIDGQAWGSADTTFNVLPLLAAYFPPRAAVDVAARPEWRGPADDDVLLEKALSARLSASAAFGGKATFADLWKGNAEKNNENDMALAAHLAFWTGCDEERIERMMYRSGLVRDKWRERRRDTTYIGYTIRNACAGCENVYQELQRKETPPTLPLRKPTVQNAAELQQRAFNPIQWALHDLLPEGVTILSSDPKLGKSWMVYTWCIAVATGRPIWDGRPPEKQGDALLLALEDNDRRMRRRLDKLLPTFGNPAIGRLFYACDWPRSADGVAAIREFLISHPETRIVVVDTIAAFRNADPGRKNQYTWDYEVGALLKPLSQEFQCAFVLVSHNRKPGNGDNHVNHEVSGSTGLTGGVDNVFVLKRSSGNVTAVLHTDGRDIEKPLELALQLHDGKWQFVGNAQDVNRSQQRNSVLEALATLKGCGTALEIHHAMGATERLGTLRVRLSRMVRSGEIDLNGKIYTLAHPDKFVTPQTLGVTAGIVMPGSNSPLLSIPPVMGVIL